MNKLFLYFLLIFGSCTSLFATPDLFVHMNKVRMDSDEVSVEVERNTSSDRLESLTIHFKNKTIKVPKNQLKKIWAPSLQDIKLTKSIDRELFQLYIEFGEFSPDGSELPENSELSEFELIVYFNKSAIKDMMIRKDGSSFTELEIHNQKVH